MSSLAALGLSWSASAIWTGDDVVLGALDQKAEVVLAARQVVVARDDRGGIRELAQRLPQMRNGLQFLAFGDSLSGHNSRATNGS